MPFISLLCLECADFDSSSPCACLSHPGALGVSTYLAGKTSFYRFLDALTLGVKRAFVQTVVRNLSMTGRCATALIRKRIDVSTSLSTCDLTTQKQLSHQARFWTGLRGNEPIQLRLRTGLSQRTGGTNDAS
jgi:hypothetical protein